MFSHENFILARYFIIALLALSSTRRAGAAEKASWAGEYADKKFLNGSAVFQLTIEQSGAKIQVSFDAAKNNGQGCTPETQTIAKETAKGLEFTFRDNQGNSGTGQIARSGDDLVVSLQPTKVANKDCVGFYRENIRVKRLSK